MLLDFGCPSGKESELSTVVGLVTGIGAVDSDHDYNLLVITMEIRKMASHL